MVRKRRVQSWPEVEAKMEIGLEELDKVVDTYAEARKVSGPERALEALRFAVYSRVDRSQVGETFRQIGCVAKSYAKVCRLMSNPRCGIEVPLALSTVCFCIASIFFSYRVVGQDNYRHFNTVWAIMAANGFFLVMYIIKEIARKWCDFMVLAAIYDELAEYACRETCC
ncbi:GSU0071 family protein [Pelotalea chapellei]|uniref:Uncharacterized protein n=1 Tax=Pelotalea chapellei TaxID=44671 RepID=A0ABS5UB60_9BACT|nr:hypothetical protein [Pelotalea chapellei]MBT1072898.1 hypothetical protein [Pelotalea chapellei]